MKKYIKSVRGKIVLRFIFNSIQAVTYAFMPIILMDFVNDFVDRNLSLSRSVMYIGGYIGMMVIGFFASIGYNYCQFEMLTSVTGQMKKDFFSSLCTINLNDFSKKEVGHYLSMDNNDIPSAAIYVDTVVETIVFIVEILIYTVIIIVRINWIVAAVLFGGCFIAVVISGVFDDKLSKLNNAYLLEVGDYNSKYKSLLEARQSINALAKGNVIKKYNAMQDTVIKKRMSYFRVKAVSLSYNGYITFVPHLFTFITCALLIYFGWFNLGVLVGAMGFIESFSSNIECLQNNKADIASLKEVIKRVLNDMEAMKKKADGKKELNDFKTIQFKDVSLEFGDKTIIDGASFELEKGKKYVMVGKNGSGKSSLIKCLLGQNEDYTGGIYADEKNLKEYRFIDNVWYVSQSDFVIGESYDNVVSMFGAFDAAKAKKIDTEIKGFEDTAFTSATDCNKLSGGEKQLLSLERALISNAKMLIMDEPFSAMDGKIKEKVYNYLKNMDITLLFVSHDDKEALSWVDDVIEVSEKKVLVRSA